MNYPEDALTRAGHLLYKELPEEYRYRDVAPAAGELGDLEAYLHGFGHLLDLIRHTTEQAYADAFAEQADNGYEIQPWLIPYLAELVGAELQAPDPQARIEELNNAVGWSKSKGTLRNVDSVGDVVTGAETVVREGWRLTLVTPRMNLPPFSVPDVDAEDDLLGRTPAPLGCPDLRKLDRAVVDPQGGNPLFRLRYPVRDAEGISKGEETVFWASRARGGAPCFPGAYDDFSARTPDLRDAGDTASLGPHPRRTRIHMRPPDGFFAPGLRVVNFDKDDPNRLSFDAGALRKTYRPRDILERAGHVDAPVPDRLVVQLNYDLAIRKGNDIRFENILFVTHPNATEPARLRVLSGGKLTLHRCAAEVVSVAKPPNDEDIPFIATDSIFETIVAPAAAAELVYCTVMGALDLMRLNASDCLLHDLGDTIRCDDQSCIRYSRLTAPDGDATCFVKDAPVNTDIVPRFLHRWLREDSGDCVLRRPVFGEPGYGVLDTTTSPRIIHGAEDEGEMGAYHHRFFAASFAALEKKLTSYLPLGQEIALSYDPHLSLKPPILSDGS
ncbi:hypothetical protein J7413_14450 [Shimia sp. R10_1]|uniref:hypothetical protein n=1 Tax=Shimia sp. R10_1 TaxID=2821095 RepID=UPI001ADC6EB5|nr:hypothetical protein [Shimia sp. R10_1]MBO9474747.1 hypothetical protein [Shimia sp. R10_1]